MYKFFTLIRLYQKYILSVLFFFLVFGVIHAEQKAAIVLKTERLWGEIAFTVHGTNMQVDLGDGRIKRLPDSPMSQIWTLEGNTIKIYGNVTFFDCQRSEATALTFNCPTIREVHAYLNQIQGLDMENLINSLPAQNAENPGKLQIQYAGLMGREENICTKELVAIAKKKYWNVYDSEGRPYEGKEDPQDEAIRKKKAEIIQTLKSRPVGFLNGYESQDEVDELFRVLESYGSHPTLAQLDSLSDLIDKAPRLQPAPNQHYAFINKKSMEALHVMYVGGKMQMASDMSMDSIEMAPNALVQLVPSKIAGQYYLMSCGKYIGKTSKQRKTILVDDMADAGMYVIKNNKEFALVNVQDMSSSTPDKACLSADAEKNVMGWGQYVDASAWYVMPVDSIYFPMQPAAKDTCYATLSAPFNVMLPADVKAYRLTSVNKMKKRFVFEPLPGNEVPANTPVLLKGQKKMCGMKIDEAPMDAEKGVNLLTGVPLQMKARDKKNAYVFSVKDGVPGFYHLEGDYLPGNCAYYRLPEAEDGALYDRFSLFGEGLTALPAVIAKHHSQKGAWYDLSGRRVAHPQKGVYVKNGKKIIF